MASLKALLDWLAQFPGATWDERWLACGADRAPRAWVQSPAFTVGKAARADAVTSLSRLLTLRVLRPSYSFLLATKFTELFQVFPLVNHAEDFDRLRGLPLYQRQELRVRMETEACLIRVMVRTGKSLCALVGTDLLEYADVVKTSGRQRREHLAWALMVALGPFASEPPTLRSTWSAMGNSRQRSVTALVDRYGLPSSPVRDLLVEYLAELKPSLDYSSLDGLACHLARVFWWEVLQINPGQADLRLSPQIAAAWRERVAVTGRGLAREDLHSLMFHVRAFYRDIQQWALEDPARWGRWAAPCPLRRTESRAVSKAKHRVRARMQQRTRMLSPLLPKLLATAGARRAWSRRFLEAAAAVRHDEEFVVDGFTYRRYAPPRRYARNAGCLVRAVGPDGLVNLTALEADCFWAWAVIETLRLTGCRIEELLEITQLSVRHYTPAKTGRLVPLLHIVPSKLDIERLIPMSPELVSVLLAVQRRAKDGDAHVPLTVRYDSHERIYGTPLPHLFVHRVGSRRESISTDYVRNILNKTAAAADLRDNGHPVHFTPHDFRRLFATELVRSGLPLHIVAALLGHLNLDTTCGYTAIFPEDVIRHYQEHIEQRRKLRPEEYREPSSEEWAEFEEHFLLRTVALGDCMRPYGTPCVHEHACVRCPFLRVDIAQLPRLEQIQQNTTMRLEEARAKGWLGEVAGLEESLRHIARRRREAHALVERTGTEEGLAARLVSA
jgi:integrase